MKSIKNSEKIQKGIILILILILFVVLFLFFQKDKQDVLGPKVETEITGEIENQENVVAVFDGENITRGDVGTSLFDAELNAISLYLSDKCIDGFFCKEKGMELTDEELELNCQMVKKQIGDADWNMYLMYYAKGSEETFREQVRKASLQEKYTDIIVDSLKESITDEDLEKIYNENPDENNILVMDVIQISDEVFEDVSKMVNDGKTLEEISEAVDSEILEKRYAYYGVNTNWNVDIYSAKIGDIVHTTPDSGSLFVGKIIEKHEGFEDELVKDTLLTNNIYNLATEQVDKEYEEYLKSISVSIFGVEMTAYDALYSGEEE